MESTSLISNPLLSRPVAAAAAASIRLKRAAIPTKVFAAKRDCRGRIVDESMIYLRKRIHEMKIIERNYEPPAEWMDWEKRYYTSYDSMICDILGVVQTQLMNTRPSVALGMLALIAISVPTSAAVVLAQLAEVSKGILAGMDAVLSF